MKLNDVAKGLLAMGEIDLVLFRQYGHHSDIGLSPSRLCEEENNWIFSKIITNHIEIRNNMCEVHIQFTETEHNGIKYSKYEFEKLFWKSLE